MKYCIDYDNIFHMYAEMHNIEQTEIQLKIQNSQMPSLVVTTPTVGRTVLNLAAVNYAVITQLFWVLNEHPQSFTCVVQLGQNSIQHTWLLNKGPGGKHNRARDLDQHSAEAKMRVQYS